MTLIAIDTKKMELTLQPVGTDKQEVYKATADTRFVGHRGAKRTIEDAELRPGVVLGVIADGTTLEEVTIPKREPAKEEAKPKEK
jgi:hypothetical protein